MSYWNQARFCEQGCNSYTEFRVLGAVQYATCTASRRWGKHQGLLHTQNQVWIDVCHVKPETGNRLHSKSYIRDLLHLFSDCEAKILAENGCQHISSIPHVLLVAHWYADNQLVLFESKPWASWLVSDREGLSSQISKEIWFYLAAPLCHITSYLFFRCLLLEKERWQVSDL